MPSADNSRDEIMRSSQLLIIEGTKVMAAFAAAHGLHQTDVEALIRVMVAHDRGVPMTAGALASELGLTSGAITFVVDRLERAGHVSRVRSDTDRRKVLLHHSSAGQALAEDFFGSMTPLADAAMDQFTSGELAVVRRFLDVTATGMAARRQSLTPSPRSSQDVSRSEQP